MMGGGLSLIKTDFEQLEKRVLPRYPLCYLTFKETEGRVFEVREISLTGMQLCLKNGDIEYGEGGPIKGSLHWIGQNLDIQGEVRWVKGNRLGLSFEGGESFSKIVGLFMSPENIATHMKAIPFLELEYEIPANLDLWFRADGPADLFIWKYNDEALFKFQIILMNYFVEWEDGVGLITGTVRTQRSLDNPLSEQDEVVFKVDEQRVESKLQFARDVVTNISEEKLDSTIKNFLTRKLRG